MSYDDSYEAMYHQIGAVPPSHENKSDLDEYYFVLYQRYYQKPDLLNELRSGLLIKARQEFAEKNQSVQIFQYAIDYIQKNVIEPRIQYLTSRIDNLRKKTPAASMSWVCSRTRPIGS